jgi:hypothetical protein
MVSETMPLGPRRTAVSRAEVDVTVFTETLNLALDNKDWIGATLALAELRKARAEVDRLLTAWILDIPGAAEFFDPKGRLIGEPH